MAEKTETQETSPDHVPEVESTGFNSENIIRTMASAYEHARIERATFTQAQTFAKAAAYRLGVIEGDLERHIRAVHDGVRIRTLELQASLSVADIDKAIAELQKARDVLDAAAVS